MSSLNPSHDKSSTQNKRPGGPPSRTRMISTSAPQQRSAVWAFERIYGITVLFMATGTWLPQRLLGRAPSSSLTEGDPVQQGVWVAVYILGAVFLFPHLSRARSLAWPSLVPYLLLLLAAPSTLWSEQPELTAKRTLSLAGTFVLGTYFGLAYSPRQFLRLIAIALSLSVGLSLITIAIFPEFAVDPYGAWTGIYGQKNWLGRVASFVIVLLLLNLIVGKSRHRLVQVSVILVAGILLLFSQSATSAALLLTGLSISLAAYCIWKSPVFSAIALFWSAPVLILLLVTLSPDGLDNARLLGRDNTLTGRTPLWGFLLDAARERPFLGYSYGGFWTGSTGASQAVTESMSRLTYGTWIPSVAHNGYLDLVLSLGIVGLAFYLCSLVLNLSKSFEVVRQESAVANFFPIVFLAFFTVANLTESILLVHNSIFWILYLAVTLWLWNQPSAFARNPEPVAPARIDHH